MLKAGVRSMTEPREPKSDVTRVEDTTDTGQLFALAMALEEVKLLSNEDKRRLREFITDSLDIIDTSRRPAPCPRWRLGFCPR